MEDYLRAKGYWYWIKTSIPPETDAKGRRECMQARDQAIGEIRRHLSPELRDSAGPEAAGADAVRSGSLTWLNPRVND